MESTAYIKNVNSTPKKLRLLVAAVKKLSPVDALETLRYTPKKSAKTFGKALASALSNARTTLKVPDYMVQFKSIAIEEGQKLKRFNPGSKGSAKPYVKRYAHIKIVLEPKTTLAKAAKAASSHKEAQEPTQEVVKKTVKTAKKSEK